MRKHSMIKWIFALIGLSGFCLLAAYYDQCAPFDKAIFSAVSLLRCDAVTLLMRGFTALASPAALVMIGGILFFCLHQKEYRVPLLANLTVAVLLNLGLKSNFTRQRPEAVSALVTEVGYSFPSGHAMAAMAFYGFLIFLCARLITKKKARRLLIGALSVVILLVGVSRIYLGVHFCTDVLAGYCASFAYLIVFTAMIGRYIRQGRDERTLESPNRKNGSLFESFGHAFDGICAGLRNERNMVIHFVAMILVVCFGVILGISALEWTLCILCIGAVFTAELINTAIEASVDLSTDHPDPRAKLAKDAAAGAVLVAALASAAVGAIIFLPKLYQVILAGIS